MSAPEVLAFDQFLNEPPEYEDKRYVREFRHDAYPLWQKALEALRRETEALQTDAYAEGRKDEREDRSRAALDVLAERERQVTAEGYTPEHDDDHHYPAELARAAICYADVEGVLSQEDHDRIWPWEAGAWKPKHARRDLVRATALLLAAIESGDRGGWLDSGEPS